MKVALLALIVTLVTSVSSAQTTVDSSCNPTIVAVEYFRGAPWTYVDQGLESIRRLYPTHVLLAERRADQLGKVTFSLLVYKEDVAKPDLTIEGMAVEGPPDNLKAWRFAAKCQTKKLADGLVTLLEEIAKLSRSF